MKERLFEAVLIGLSLGLFAAFPGFPMAIVCFGAFSYLGLLHYLAPPVIKPISEEDRQALLEELKNLRGEIGLVKAALGLSKPQPGTSRARVSVFSKS